MHPTTIARTVAAAGLSLLALGSLANQASADPPAAGVFSVGGGGISTVEDDGDVVFTGPGLASDRRLREMLDVTLTVVVSPDAGELPAVGSCTPATSTFVVDGKRGAGMTLEGTGDICSRVIFGNFVETVFEGTFDVVDAQRQDLRGTSGTYRVNITPNGFTSAYASSFVPS